MAIKAIQLAYPGSPGKITGPIQQNKYPLNEQCCLFFHIFIVWIHYWNQLTNKWLIQNCTLVALKGL